jgi:hypothetical protein
MIQDAKKVQKQLYADELHVMNRDDINCTIIAGINTATATKLNTEGGKITSVGYSPAGDGTVPLVSAIESNGELFNNPIYLVNGVNHSELFSDGEVIDLVKNLLSSKTDFELGEKISTPKEGQSKSSEIVSDELETVEETRDNANSIWGDVYDMVVAYCPVSLTLLDDDGNEVGTVSSEGIAVKDKKDLTLFRLLDGGETKQVVVPEGYEVKVNGKDDGKMDLMMATMSSSGEMMQRYMYRDISVNPTTLVDVQIHGDHSATLQIDENGDGKADQTRKPEDAQYQSFISLETGMSDGAKLWILLGSSIALILCASTALLIITLVYQKKIKKID